MHPQLSKIKLELYCLLFLQQAVFVEMKGAMCILTALLLVITLALVGADQAVKYWASVSLQPKGSIDFIHFGNFKLFDLTYLENDGAIFGSMSGKRWFLIGFTSLILIVGVVILLKYRKRSKLLTSSLLLFVSGGVGNLIDRIRYGYVIDMFEFKPFKFAIFNVADIYVTLAVALIIIYILFVDAKLEKNQKKITEKAEKHD